MIFTFKVILIIIILYLIGITIFLILNRKKEYFEDNSKKNGDLPSEYILDIGNNTFNQTTGPYYPESVVNLASYINILINKSNENNENNEKNFVSSMYLKSIADSNDFKKNNKLPLSSTIANFMFQKNYFTMFLSCQNDEKLREKYLEQKNKYVFADFLGNTETKCNNQLIEVDKIRDQFMTSQNTKINDSKIFITDIKYFIKNGKIQYNEFGKNENILDIIKKHIYCEGPLGIEYETTESQYNLDYYGIQKGDSNITRIINGIIIGWTKGDGEDSKNTNILVSLSGTDGIKPVRKRLASEAELSEPEPDPDPEPKHDPKVDERKYKINLGIQVYNIFKLNCASDYVSLTVSIVETNELVNLNSLFESVAIDNNIIGMINWGDNTINTMTSHIYNATGEYTILIYGIIYRLSLTENRQRNRIIRVNKYGIDTKLVFLSGLSSLVEIPNLPTSVSNIKLPRCSSFNQDINNWNVENITDMSNMFFACTSFNQPLNNWNVSNVTNMERMFANCSVFNGSLNDWNVEKVTNMFAMFSNCYVFNQDLSSWERSGFSTLENVTNMGSMFYECNNFNNGDQIGQSNRPLNWNVRNVTNMGNMFYNCESFNQDISNWNVGIDTRIEGMFDGCTSCRHLVCQNGFNP